MKRVFVKVFLLALAILFSMVSMVSVSYAQIEAGTKEIGGFASLSLEDSTTTYSIMPIIGYFLNPEVELGLTVFASRFEMEGFSSSDLMFLGQAKYHFYQKGQTTVPYVGGQLGIYTSSNGETNTSFSFGGMGGAKFFLKENVSLNLEANYTYMTDSDSDGRLEFLAGVSYYFGK